MLSSKSAIIEARLEDVEVDGGAAGESKTNFLSQLIVALSCSKLQASMNSKNI
jgi:hypothetical protein